MIFHHIQLYTVFIATPGSVGCGDKILEHLVKKTRTNAGRKENPSYAIIDSQSVKTVAASKDRGIDSRKNKRKEAAHRSGCAGLLSVVVHTANIHDTKSGISTAKRAYKRYPSIQKFCADAGYRGAFVSDLKGQLDLDVGISEKSKPHQWEKLPWRWVVERTLSWLNIPDVSAKIMRFPSHLLRLWS